MPPRRRQRAREASSSPRDKAARQSCETQWFCGASTSDPSSDPACQNITSRSRFLLLRCCALLPTRVLQCTKRHTSLSLVCPKDPSARYSGDIPNKLKRPCSRCLVDHLGGFAVGTQMRGISIFPLAASSVNRKQMKTGGAQPNPNSHQPRQGKQVHAGGRPARRNRRPRTAAGQAMLAGASREGLSLISTPGAFRNVLGRSRTS